MKKRLVLLCALVALFSIVAFAADVTGKWVGEANPNGKGGPPTFNLKQDGTKLTGTSVSPRGDSEVSNGKVDGDKVSFEVTRDMGDKGKFTTKYSGTVSGTTMKLTAETEGRGSRDITLTKQ
jgi:opacity protein-like surface antigen